MTDADRLILTLITRHERDLFAFAFRLCRDAQDAGDLVQDTFERALRRRERLRADGNPRAWLMAILQHVFVDGYRRRRHQPVAMDSEALDAAAEASASPLPTSFCDEEAPSAAWEAYGPEDVERAVACLTEGLRHIYQLHIAQGRTYKEISALLNIPVGTVGTRLARARHCLRAELERQAPLS